MVPEFYQGYVDQIIGGSVIENLMMSGDRYSDLLQGISEEKGSYSYAEGKWTVKELAQHVNDTERVFAYRALAFIRNDQTPLPGFDQDLYVKESRANERKLASILNEFHILRASSIDLFARLSMAELRRTGTASGGEFTVEGMGYVISGHCLHHLGILKSKYLNGH